MSAVEKIEKNKIKLTFEATPAFFREGLTYAYNKTKNQFNIPGFRKGKAPRKVIERLYGAEFFYEDAINFVLPRVYEDALNEYEIEPVSQPDFDLVEATEDKGAVFTAEVYIKPEVTIEGYGGITYPESDTEPTEADIEVRLQIERDKNARIISVNRPAENGDIVSINFTGYIDGEPFEGGKADNQDLTLGSHSFIDTFEEQLIGHVPGDDVEVNVTFPEKYGHQALAGKDAQFKVEVLDVKIREYPEINDEFAQDVSEYDTLEAYRQYLADTIRENKIRKAREDKEIYVLKRLVEKAEMDVPEIMYTSRVDNMVEDLRRRIQMQGLTMDMYLQYAEMTEAALRQEYAVSAKEAVDSMLVLDAVAKKEALTVSEDEYNEQIAQMAKQSGQSVVQFEKMVSAERKKYIIQELMAKKALDLVLAQAVAEEATAEKVEETNPTGTDENTAETIPTGTDENTAETNPTGTDENTAETIPTGTDENTEEVKA